ncbi:MAG: protease pro-enzyme activation domain-containing protein [Terracidiphilus sp.]
MRPTSPLPLHAVAGVFFCSAILLSSSALPAQNSATAPRITANVDESLLTTLKGNVPQRARAQYDQGEAPGSTQMTHMRLVLQRSSQQQAALDVYLSELQDKSSPNYHKWLTPAEFGKLYGPADSDVVALVAWLESHGLKLEAVSLGRTTIAFGGTVGQVEEAFHTTIHSFTVNGEQFFSNTTDPQIPQALTPVVKGVANLNTIRPKPQFERGSEGKFNPQSKRLEPANGPTPTLTETSGGDFLWIVPGDAATIYDTPNSYNANFSGGTSYNGAGVNIGIGGAATILASIVESYRETFLGNSTSPIFNYCTSSNSCSSVAGGGYNNKDNADEAYIDTELSGGIAPGAAIYYYASADLTTGIEAAIDANVIDIFSLSFGDCESDMGASGNAQLNSIWEQAAAQGIAVAVSTGDSGSAGCDDDNTQTTANGGLQVSGFASTPYNIAVGGTDFYALKNSFTTYVTTGNEGTSGNNYDYYRTALKYIPESTWNDSTTNNTTISANVTSTNSDPEGANIVAGSGGVSSVYSKPSWQTGTGVPADGKRDLPDVSLMSGDGNDSAGWLVCTDDPTTYQGQTVTEDCETQSDGYFFFAGYGGTSTAAPTFAGILALVEQKTGGRLGQAAAQLQELYNLSNGSHASSIFHDVTVGNNSVPCFSGSPDCVQNAAGHYFESGYNTTVGYDLATGLGSVDATQLVNYWSSLSGSMAANVNANPTPNPVTTVEALSVQVSVTGGSGTATGTVTLSGGGYSSAKETLVGGDYTFSVPAGSLMIGDDTLTITYSGDSTYAAKNITTSVQVNGLTAAVAVNPVASINSNQSLTVTGTVSGSGGTPTGFVTLTGGGYTSPATAVTSGSYSIAIPANSLSAGSDLLTVTYGGNSIYDAGAFGTTTVGVTLVVVLTPTVTVTPASTSLYSSQSLNVTVMVAGTGATPTGTVTLASGSYSSGAQTLAASGSCTAALCTITIPPNSLNNSVAGKSDALTATYSGDANYFPGSGTANVTVAESVYSVASSTPAAVSPGGSTTSTITVSSNLFYSGTVTLGCQLTNSPPGAEYPPTCSMTSGSTVDMSAGAPSPATSAAMVNTTAATSELVYPKLHGGGWAGAGGGAILALLVFLGIPSRRRSWRQMLGLVVLMAAIGGMTGCGSPSSTGINQGKPGTTAGTYTFTVTGTGNPSITPSPTTTFTVTVN